MIVCDVSLVAMFSIVVVIIGFNIRIDHCLCARHYVLTVMIIPVLYLPFLVI